VRRAFLCGYDPVSGKNFEHRKDWIQQRLQLLAGACAIEVLDFALLDNHIHLILRTRPDIAQCWSDQEVVKTASTVSSTVSQQAGD
jgi:REP element-mobilizing transposase RayT